MLASTHSVSYLDYIKQISVSELKMHSPNLYSLINEDEKETIKKSVYQRIKMGDRYTQINVMNYLKRKDKLFCIVNLKMKDIIVENYLDEFIKKY